MFVSVWACFLECAQGAERMAATDFAERKKELERERERVDSSMSKRGLAEGEQRAHSR